MRTKHFLDTTVVYKLLTGTEFYREYLKKQFKEEPLFISAYIRMEFKRSFIVPLIGFYNVLNMSTIKHTNDAVRLWNDEYKKNYQVASSYLREILGAHQLMSDNKRDKERALLVIAKIIKRLDLFLNRRFSDTGIDSTRCFRELVPLKLRRDFLTRDLIHYVEQFNDVDTCRNKCNIHLFLLKKRKEQVKKYVELAYTLKGDKHAKGYVKISKNLEQILDKGESICTCHRCQLIGDAVIALDTPEDMQIEHIDHSFDYLCPPINIAHNKLIPPKTLHHESEK